MARATRTLRSLPVWAISAIVFVTIAGALAFQDSPRAIGQEYATDATLSALALSEVNFGAFSSSTESYTASVAYSVYLTTVSPTVNHSGASYVVKLGGATDSDGTVSLSVGGNVITVEVTAEDGNTTRTYTVTVTRAANAYLALLSLSGIELEHDSVFYPRDSAPLSTITPSASPTV